MNTKLSLKVRALIIEVVNASEKPLNSMQVKRLVESEVKNESYDWHEYLYYLEDLTRRGIMQYAGVNDGRQQYAIACR